MTELQKKVHAIQERLATGDAHEQGVACDEALELMETLTEIEQKETLCSIIIAPLLDLNRENDWHMCLNILQQSSVCRLQMTAVFSEAWWFMKRKDISGMIDVYEKGISIATTHEDKQAMAECYLGKGKSLIQQSEMTQALDAFGMCIETAKQVFNLKMVAVATYYIAIVMLALGKPAIALEKLREASDIAVAQKSQNIVKHIEVVRAHLLLEQGDAEKAKTILNDWTTQFALML